MRVILGGGSIGKWHAPVFLEQLRLNVEVATRMAECVYPHYESLSAEGDSHRFDYFVIETGYNRHYQNLLDLDSMVLDRIILVEKPLFFQEADSVVSEIKYL
jgi:hypothetical protein